MSRRFWQMRSKVLVKRRLSSKAISLCSMRGNFWALFSHDKGVPSHQRAGFFSMRVLPLMIASCMVCPKMGPWKFSTQRERLFPSPCVIELYELLLFCVPRKSSQESWSKRHIIVTLAMPIWTSAHLDPSLQWKSKPWAFLFLIQICCNWAQCTFHRMHVQFGEIMAPEALLADSVAGYICCS